MPAESSAAPAAAATAPPLRVPHLSAGWLRWLRRTFAMLQAVSPALAARAAFRLFLRTYRHPLRPEDGAALAQARRHRLSAGSDEFVVYEWGAGERRAIILHGWGSSAARFTHMAAELQARGWHVLVADAPGHGASPGHASSLPRFIAALDAIVARFGPPQALIGHSLGALAIARRHADGPPEWAGHLQGVVLISMPSGAPFLIEVFLRALRLEAATRARLLALFEARFDALADSYCSLPGAAHITARLLLVHDAGDDIVPHAHSAALLRELPEAELATTTGLGHSALTRDAATIARIADFVGESAGAA
jgi:pimeloyl-ACP methyl ester carboxylesterase